MTTAPSSPNMVDCKECATKFATFKLYISHLIAKQCAVARNKTQVSASSKRALASPSTSPTAKKSRPEKLPCGLCARICKNQRSLSMHITTAHKCPYCEGRFENVSQHTRAVHETEACTECQMKVVTKSLLKIHMERMHAVKCESCDEQFYRKEIWAEHREKVHEEECDICHETFLKSSSLLEVHQGRVHGIQPRVVKQFAAGMFIMVSE